MIEQSNVGITRPAVDGALVLEYEDMFTGKRSKLSRSQCLCLGRIEIPKIRRLPNVLAPQICSIGDFEGERVMSTGGPSIGLLRTSTSGHAVVELTSSRIASPPRCVSNRNSLNNDDGTDVIDSRAEGISVNDLKHVGSRTFFLESTEVLMHILDLVLCESTLHSESNASAITRVEAVSTMTFICATCWGWRGHFGVGLRPTRLVLPTSSPL